MEKRRWRAVGPSLALLKSLRWQSTNEESEESTDDSNTGTGSSEETTSGSGSSEETTEGSTEGSSEGSSASSGSYDGSSQASYGSSQSSQRLSPISEEPPSSDDDTLASPLVSEDPSEATTENSMDRLRAVVSEMVILP